MSQEALGAALRCSKSYVSKLESGLEQPSLEVALRIQVVFEGEIRASDLRPDLAELIAAAAEAGASSAAPAAVV